jgi:hypothetical protein
MELRLELTGYTITGTISTSLGASTLTMVSPTPLKSHKALPKGLPSGLRDSEVCFAVGLVK